MEILCFLAGTVFACSQSAYPLLFVLSALFLKANGRLVLWFLAAIIWALVHQWWIDDQGMPSVDVIPKTELTGKITSVPDTRIGKVQFELSVTRLNQHPVKARVLLSCYNHCPTFATGQTWRVQAKLKRPQSSGNPGQFDYRRMLYARHIAWVGYLKHGQAVLIQEPEKSWQMLALRAQLAEKLRRILPDKTVLGITQALTLGLINNIDSKQWDLFRRTGTTHLMVISGAHISLVAGLAYCLVYWLWLLSGRLCLYRPAAQAAAIAGILGALTYALLAGFSVPAQRAVIAFCLLLLRHFFSQRLTGWQTWRYALLAVLVMEPHAVLFSGFYLSFLAVAILLSLGQRITCGGLKKTLILQLACLIGLMPVTLFFFSYGAVDGFFANLFAIPFVGYIIVPLALLTLLISIVCPAGWATLPLTWAIKGLLVCLAWVDRFSLINLDMTLVSVWSMLALMIAIMLRVFLPVRALAPLALVLLITALYPGYYRNKPGDAQVVVLDVGQGLSVVITTAHHTMLYDTGMKFYQGGDMAKMVIIPYLATQGISAIDKLVISHPDMDHRGGLASLESRFPVGELIVDNVDFYHRGKNCHDYPAWSWDGVSFRFLPIRQAFRDKNNSSCVLQVSNPAGKVLLPGDVEALAEHYLATRYPEELASGIVILAHHGSKTSSTPEFIQRVAPRYGIISAGFDNRYHFPHQQTLNTMKERNIGLFDTMTCGMLTIDLRVGSSLREPLCYRKNRDSQQNH